jgi:RNA polymerase sigma factor (sigma-70 family)
MATAQLGTLLRHIQKLAGDRSVPDGTDRQLLDDFAVGRDQAAFATLVARHGPMVLRVCRRVLGHEQDAEDAFQATFLVLAQGSTSIRKREAVADWLHGVAYRTAMKAKRSTARRRNHEARLRERTSLPVASPTWDDVQAILDSEIQRLPESFRAAFVLCVLDGKTVPEAAAELGVKVGTVSSRLTRARKQLQHQLARRGIKLSALLAALSLAEGGGKAAVPSLLAKTTVCSGLLIAAGETAAGVIPSQVAALAAGVTRAMFLSRIKIATAVFLAVGLFVAGAGLWKHQALAAEEPPAANEEAKRPTEPVQPAATAKDEEGDTIEVSGHVLDPEGKPIAGSKLYLLDPSSQGTPRKVLATSGADGGFRFTVPQVKERLTPYYTDSPWNHVFVLAVADGFGSAFRPLGSKAPGELTLQLVKDDLPINGRVLDLQGKPVPGATVRIIALYQPRKGDLAPFVEGLQERKEGYAVQNDLLQGLLAWHDKDLSDAYPLLTTGADGRFQLKNIGRERLVRLRLEGPTIATGFINVMTRPGGRITVPEWKRNPEGGVMTYYGVTFDHAAAPTKPVIGVVRDQDTGQPLAGAVIESYMIVGSNISGRTEMRTVTDKDGRYRLTGLPKGQGNQLRAGPPAGEPYLMSIQKMADTPGLEPVVVDFKLKRGVWITGKVTDKATGQPVPAQIEYAVFDDNPHRKDAPGLTFDHHMRNRPKDGSFRFVGLPGHGLVAARAWGDRHLLASGAEEIKGITEQGYFNTYPHLLFPIHFHRLVELNAGKDAESVTCDLVLDPGRTVTGTVLGPDGRPLAGARVSGLRAYGHGAAYWENEPLKTSEFTVAGLTPGRRRLLILLHEGKRLAGSQVVRGEEQGAVTIKLEPWGTVTGRLVTADGTPMARAECFFLFGDKQDELTIGSHPARSFSTDRDGKFRIEGLVPGLKYTLSVANGNMLIGRVFENLTIPSGQTKDLGDVKLKPFE